MDIIAIGALNFDYVFNLGGSNFEKSINQGEENFSSNSRKSLELEIDALSAHIPCSVSFGGSSFNAIRSSYCINNQLETAFVGTYCMPTEREIAAGFSCHMDDIFSFLHDKKWLFLNCEKAPGIALVKTAQGTRDSINIHTGINDHLRSLIIQHNSQNKDGAFAHYLASAKWIHLSSLADFSQFLFFINEIEKARDINPSLIVSIDPGYEYTKSYARELIRVFSVVNYVFLNAKELDNLIGHKKTVLKRKTMELCDYNKNPNLNTVFVIKKRDCHEFIFKFKDLPCCGVLWHKVLKKEEIFNDTGAGDTFAGGFIASMLHNNNIATSIKTGHAAATIRMCSRGDIYKDIHRGTQGMLF